MRKVLIVTGGSRGIGAATAAGAAEGGWDVCVNYRENAARAEEVADRVRAAGRRAVAVKGDVSVEADVLRLFATCDGELGRVDGLVNSAGILDPLSRVDEIDGGALVRHMMVNVVGTILCAREAAKRMSLRRGGNGGAIVNLSSRTSELGGAGSLVHYGAAKAAVNAFTFGFAQEVAGEGIRVAAVSPGVIDTEIQPPGRLEAVAPALPMARAGEAAEVANAVLWLLSDAASYVSGTVLNVSGAR